MARNLEVLRTIFLSNRFSPDIFTSQWSKLKWQRFLLVWNGNILSTSSLSTSTVKKTIHFSLQSNDSFLDRKNKVSSCWPILHGFSGIQSSCLAHPLSTKENKCLIYSPFSELVTSKLNLQQQTFVIDLFVLIPA